MRVFTVFGNTFDDKRFYFMTDAKGEHPFTDDVLHDVVLKI